MRYPKETGFYMFLRDGEAEWRPTEVFEDDYGDLVAYKTWENMQFPSKSKLTYNAWTCVYKSIHHFHGEFIKLEFPFSRGN